MYRPPTKRTEILRRTATYASMVVAILALVTVLVFVILGYRFNRGDGKIEQGGLVQFDSQPGGATIGIDGTTFGARTAAKTTMTSGNHYVTMDRTGYRQWSKAVSVMPGAILWLNYARLIPKDLPVANVATFTTVSSSVASPSREWMVVATDPALPELQLVDLRPTDPVTTKLTLPEALYTHPAEGKTQQFSVVSWDKDSRYVLVRHTIEGSDQPEWLDIDTQSVDASKNVTKLLNITASDLRFSYAGSQQLYALTDGDVRKVDISAGTISRPLVSHVAEFELYRDNGLVYTTAPDETTKQRTVGYVLDGDTEPRTLRTFAGDDTAPLHIAISQYFGDTYVAIAHGTTVSVVIGDLPKNATDLDAMKKVATMTLTDPASRLSIVTQGRFIVAEMKDSYAVYDLEIKRQTVTPLKGTADTWQKLQWIDGYMPWSDRTGTLRLYEFDGANQHDIMPVVTGQAVTLSRDNTYLYGIGKSTDGQLHLERVRLILP